MKSQDVCFIKEEVYEYPNKEFLFRPSMEYPEYPFKGDVSKTKNEIYEMIRRGLYYLKLDIGNFDSVAWNPLGEFINSGDRVLIKPNLVSDRNFIKKGTDCLYTHPALVAAVIDYVYIALKGKGTIVVGDAPVQECDFERLIEESGYKKLVEYYKGKGIDIALVDFRNVKTFWKDGLHYNQNESNVDDNGIIVQLNEDSAFSSMSGRHLKTLRITNYDPRIIQRHHNLYCHEYKIAKEVLISDVIINMPKPKTHRKAGITVSLKNMIGINANKEFLPHHAIGSKEEGGDAYQTKSVWFTLANRILDKKNIWNREGKEVIAKLADKLYRFVYNNGAKTIKEKYWEGSWYGNDTIWRTILDINKILFYADKDGKMKKSVQRRMFIVGDMIVVGEKEGPLSPSPVKIGMIAMGKNQVCFDRAVCSLMGFDYKLIPSLNKAGDMRYGLTDGLELEPYIISNDARWHGKSISDIKVNASLDIEPSSGWEYILGNPKKDEIIDEIKSLNKPIYIFGAGNCGIDIACYIKKKTDIDILGFYDNDKRKWNLEILDNIYCMKPKTPDRPCVCLISVKQEFIESIKEDAQRLGFKNIVICAYD